MNDDEAGRIERDWQQECDLLRVRLANQEAAHRRAIAALTQPRGDAEGRSAMSPTDRERIEAANPTTWKNARLLLDRLTDKDASALQRLMEDSVAQLLALTAKLAACQSELEQVQQHGYDAGLAAKARIDELETELAACKAQKEAMWRSPR